MRGSDEAHRQAPPKAMTETFVPRANLCARLNVHPSTARRWELAGRLTPFAFSGGCVRYRVSEVEQLLTEARLSNRRKPGPKPRRRSPEEFSSAT